MSSLEANNANETAAALSPVSITTNRISARWSNDEYQLAIRGMRKYGKDFQSIAEIMGTKNEPQVNQFYTNYRKKYNLDDILKEFEAKQLKEQQKKQKLNDSQQNASNLLSTKVARDSKIDMEVSNYAKM